MTAIERREANRLRSERWRRAHGIMPRKHAQRRWLATGVSRSTYSGGRQKAASKQHCKWHLPELIGFVHG
jgi:hypothetical protein